MNISKIKVAIRLRPFLPQQINQGYQNSRILFDDQKKNIQVSFEDQNNKNFEFDYAFDQKADQNQVYQGCGIDNLVQKAIQGYHSTIFAYGQTGSGKTYCMQGIQQINQINDVDSNPNLDGIIPKVINSLFQKIKIYSTQKTFTVYVSYLQIYNEKVFDLLNPVSLNPKNLNSNIEGLRLRWNKNEQFTVENLFIFECKNKQQLIKYFQFGLKNRINSAHKLNMSSSRSHTILSIKVQSFDHKNQNQILTSRIQLVDLAGSQRIGMTGTQGKLAKESIDINKSLFTLRQVISTLADWNKNKTKDQVHVPYRDSKLTSILKQSIGGNSYCLMIACINPNDRFLDENISTLTYATKATMITNRPVVNDDPRNKVIGELKVQIKSLQQELVKANKHIEIISTQKEQSSKILKMKEQVVENSQPMPVFRKKMSEKLKSNNYQQFSDRLVQSINMVRQLLKSNKDLREELQISQKHNEEKDIQIYDLEKQNESLREKLNQFNNQVIYTQQYSTKKNRTNFNEMNSSNHNSHNKQIIYNNRIIPHSSVMNHHKHPKQNHKNPKANTTANFRIFNDNTYNSFNSIQINQFYQNETGMDSMPTNFNKRQVATAYQRRNNTNVQRYKNTFTSTNHKRLIGENSIPIQKRLSFVHKNQKFNQIDFY